MAQTIELMRDESNNKDLRKALSEEVTRDSEDLEKVKEGLQEIEEALTITGRVLPTYENFLELFGSLSDTLQKAQSLAEKDRIISLIFSNFTVTDKKITAYEVREPYKSLFSEEQVLDGGR